MDDKFIQALHSELSSSYELGTVEEFGKKLASDDVFRKALFDDASKTLDLGDYATFEGQVKKKLSTEDYLPTFDNLSKSFQKRQKDKEPFSVVPPQTKQVKYEDTLPEDVTIEAVNKADKSRMDYLSGEAKKIEAGVIERVRQEATALSEKYEGAELEKKLGDLYELRSGEMQKAVETLAGETQYKYIDKDVKNYSDLFGNIFDSNNAHGQKVQQIADLRQSILNSIPEEGRAVVKGELNRLISDLATQSPMGQQFLLKTSVATTRDKLIAAHDKLKAETDKKLQAAGIDPNAIATAPPMVEKEVDELSRLQGAIDFMNRALDVPESKEGAIGDAFKSELGNILTAGVSGLLESLEVMQSARRENPTEADKALVDAYGQLQQLQGMASENVDRYRRAKSLVGSIPYMEQFLLTGGVGDLASATARKVGESVLKKGIKKRIAQAAVKRLVEPVTEGAISMIGRVPIMPMTHQNIAEAGVALKEEDGKFVVDPAQMPTIGEAIGRGVYKSATEVFSESLGGVFALPKWKWVDKIITPSAKKLFTRVGMQNPFGEYGEEIFANLFQGEKIDRQFLGDLLMTIPIMTGGFAVLSTPAIISDLKMAKKKVPSAPEVEKLIRAKDEQGLLDLVTETVTGKTQAETLDIVEGVGAMVQENVMDEMTTPKVDSGASDIAPRIEGKTESGTQVSPEGDMPTPTSYIEPTEGKREGEIIDKFKLLEERTSRALDLYATNTGNEIEGQASAELRSIREERRILHEELFKSNKTDENADAVHDAILSGEDGAVEMPNGYRAVVVDSYYEPVMRRNHTITKVVSPNGESYYIDVNTYKRVPIGTEYVSATAKRVQAEVPPTIEQRQEVTPQTQEEVSETTNVEAGTIAETAQVEAPQEPDKYKGLSNSERNGVKFAEALPLIMNRAFAMQKPFKDAFLRGEGLTEEKFNKLPQGEKDALQEKWVQSRELRELEKYAGEVQKFLPDKPVFHGTPRKFSEFNTENGVYFTPNKKYAEHYKGEIIRGSVTSERKETPTSSVVEANITINNPKLFGKDYTLPTVKSYYELTPEKIRQYKEQGYDGLIFVVEGKVHEYVVFDKAQIDVVQKPEMSTLREQEVEVERTAKDIARENLKAKWDNLKNIGVVYDPRSQAKAQVEFTEALLEYIKQEVLDTVAKIKAEVKDMLGHELSDADAEYLLAQSKGEAPPVEPPTADTTEQPEGKERTILRRVIDASNVPQEVKDELIAQGIEYIPRGRRFTHAEAQELISVFGSTEGGIDKLFAAVKDMSNGILPDTRTVLNVYVAEQYSKQLDSATDVKTREQLRKKVADAYMVGAELATMHGQAVEAQKKWQEILARDPEVIIVTKKRRQSENNKDALKAMEGDVKASRDFLEENIANSDEFKKILEERVSEEIDKIANKKYGKIDKKKIDDFFDGLLIKTDKAFDATLGIPIAVYNGAVLVIKKAVLTGVDITNAVAQGVEYINAWYKEKYDKGEIPSPDWNKDDYTAVMPERLKPLTKMVKKVRYKLPKKAEDTIVDKLYEKMATATKPQLRRLVREYVATLEEEGAVSSDRFRDLFAKAIGLEVLSTEDEQTIRLAGQSINYARKKADTLMEAFNDYLREVEQENPDKAKLAQIEADIKKKKKDANKARFAAQKAAQQLDKLLQEELELGQTLSTLIQGNLLTPISLMSNIVGNTTFLPVRGAARMVASALDNMVYGLAKAYTPLVKKIDPQKHPRLARLANGLPTPTRIYRNFASLRGFAIGFKHGSIEGAIQLYTGQLSEDIYRRESARGLEPVKAAMRFYNQLTGKEQARFDKLLSDFLEAMPAGYFAEGFFRALNLGDKPFRRAAETARLYEIAQIKGLRGKAKEAFLANPDADTLEEMRKSGEISVYQQDNIVSDLMKYLSQKLNKVDASKEHKRRSIVAKTLGSLAKVTTLPFVKTPTNLIAEAFEYAIPVVTAARGVYAMKSGDRRKATDLFGKAIVGQMFISLAVYLLKSGLLTPPPDDDNKIRQAQYEGKRGYSFNPDAAYRAMTGGDPTWQDKDRVWSYQRLGVPSMMLMGVAKAYSDVPQDKVTDLSYLERSIAMLPGIASGALDQSFLTGVSTALTAWIEGEAKFNDWFINTTKALSAAVYPNTVAQLSQTFFSDNYIREVRDMYSEDERLKRRMINTFKDRMFMGRDLPTKVTIWGEDVKRVPEGRSWPYMFFDVTKGTQYQRTTFGVKMYEMYERYRLVDEEEAKNIIPSLPSATVEVGWDKRNMTAMEVNELQKKVGTLRRMYVERLMSSEEWMDMTDEERIAGLQSIYRDASTKVKSEMFMLDIVKASDKWEFLRTNDFIPVPTSSITINGKRITGEEAADFYDQVQRLFVLELGGMPDGRVSDGMREDYKKDVEKAWARAKRDVTGEWRDKIPEPME